MGDSVVPVEIEAENVIDPAKTARIAHGHVEAAHRRMAANAGECIHQHIVPGGIVQPKVDAVPAASAAPAPAPASAASTTTASSVATPVSARWLRKMNFGLARFMRRARSASTLDSARNRSP